MNFLLIIATLVLVFWTLKLSRRLDSLEKLLSGKEITRESPPAVPIAPKQQSQPVSAQAPVMMKTAQEQAELTTVWATRIGIIALVIGVGFFLKYAIDRGWISEWTRIFMGFVTGGLLVALGNLWKDRYRSYALSLSGGGIAMLYFCVFAAYQFYNLFSQPVGAVLTILITALAVWLATRHKSVELGTLSVLGAFLSPLLLYAGRDQQIPLFIYLSIVNIGIVFVMARRFWLEILYVGFLGTVLDFSIWAVNFSTTDNTKESIFFLLFAYFLYLVVGNLIFRESWRKQNSAAKVDHLALLNVLQGAFIFAATFLLLYGNFRAALFYVWIFQAILNFIAYALVSPLDNAKLNYSLSFFGFLFVVSTAFLEFDDKGLAGVLLILAMLAIVAGLYLKRRELRVFGFCVLLISLAVALFTPYNLATYVFLFNPKFILLAIEAVAFAVVAKLFKHIEGDSEEKSISYASEIMAIMLLWFAASWEIVVAFRDSPTVNGRNLFLSLWWIIYAAVIIAVGAIRKSLVFRQTATLIFVLSILKVFLYDVQSLYIGYRMGSFIVLGVILLSVSYAYHRNKEKITQFLALGKNNNGERETPADKLV